MTFQGDELTSLATSGVSNDVCVDYCIDTSCDSFIKTSAFNLALFKIEISCTFSYFDPDNYNVTPTSGPYCHVRGEIPSVDCSSTLNCTPQLDYCGGTLSSANFQKAELLSCIPNATTFGFDLKSFIRKTHRSNDFFYNRAEKTFMNG